MYTPELPFPEYKWYWATKAPTESINDPAILLGLVNKMNEILKNNEDGNVKYSSIEFEESLDELKSDLTYLTVNLKRTSDRNIIRNSGQYWKLVGLIPESPTNRGYIELTDLARNIATGGITRDQFASSTILNLTLPNKVAYSSSYHIWEHHNLKIFPLKLILEILKSLYSISIIQAKINSDELRRVVIPLAGVKKEPNAIAEFILKYRNDNKFYNHVIEDWPDTVSKSNDYRYIKEFLIFLENYGFLQSESGNNSQKYYNLVSIESLEFAEPQNAGTEDISGCTDTVEISALQPLVSTTRRARPGQAKFRRDILQKTRRCLITGTDLEPVLEGAHIIPHSYGGDSVVCNGLLLRSDIHKLFDDGLLSIFPNGVVSLHGIARNSSYEYEVGEYVDLPSYINPSNLAWRSRNRFLGARG